MFHHDFFQPNIVIVSNENKENLQDICARSATLNLGVIYHSRDTQRAAALPFLNVWIRPQSPDWNLSTAQRETNLDLALLLAIRISQSHNLQIRLVTTLQSIKEMQAAEEYLEGLVDLGRLPRSTLAIAFLGSIWDCIHQAPSAQVHIFGLPSTEPTTFIGKVEKQIVGHRIFVQGSGKENLLA